MITIDFSRVHREVSTTSGWWKKVELAFVARTTGAGNDAVKAASSGEMPEQRYFCDCTKDQAKTDSLLLNRQCEIVWAASHRCMDLQSHHPTCNRKFRCRQVLEGARIEERAFARSVGVRYAGVARNGSSTKCLAELPPPGNAGHWEYS